MYLVSKVNFAAIVVGLVSTLAVNAQSTTPVPSSVPGLSDCASACITQAAAQNGCASFADVTCVCTNAQFQLDARECLQNQCPSDLQAALGLQSQQCGAAGLSATGTATSDAFSATGITASATSSVSGSAGSSAPAGSSPASGSTSTHPSSTSPTSRSSSGTSSASASGTSSSSSAAKVEFGYGYVLALVVSLAGVAVGTVTVL